MVDVVTDSGRVNPLRSVGLVGVHPYEVEDLTLGELLHLHRLSGCVAVGGGILCEVCTCIELAVITEIEVVVGVRGLPVSDVLTCGSPNVFGFDRTANENVSRVTLAVAASCTVSVVLVGVGEDEFTVETVTVLHETGHVVESLLVSGVRRNVVTTLLVAVLAPETRVVVLLINRCIVVRSGIVSRTGGDVARIGGLVLVVRGIVAVLLVKVERAFTLSHYVGKVRDRCDLHCITGCFTFNLFRSGIIALDFVAVLVRSNKYTSHSTLYGDVHAVDRSRRVQSLGFGHVVLHGLLTEFTGHHSDVLGLGSTLVLHFGEVIGYSEGIRRSSSGSSSSIGVDRGSGVTVELGRHHAVISCLEVVEVSLRVKESLCFGVGVNHNEYLLLTGLNLEALGRTDERNVLVTVLGLLEGELAVVERLLRLERVAGGTGCRCRSLEDVNVYRFDVVATYPLTHIVVTGVGRVLIVGCATNGLLELKLDRHRRGRLDIRTLVGCRIVIRAGSERSYRGRSREEHSCEEKMFLHNE